MNPIAVVWFLALASVQAVVPQYYQPQQSSAFDIFLGPEHANPIVQQSYQPYFPTGFGQQPQPQPQPQQPQPGYFPDSVGNTVFSNTLTLANQSNPNDPSGLGCGPDPATLNCQNDRYRTYDGTCNNLQRPDWGAPQTRYNRLLPARYGDGIMLPTTPTKTANSQGYFGQPQFDDNLLPSARLVSLQLYKDIPIEDPLFTLNAMQYGQIITHDMSMIAGSTQAQPHQTRCCTDAGQLLELARQPEHCFPIELPSGDPISQQTGRRCMNFVRTITDRDRRCVGGNQPAEQLTAVNHFLDLSLVYGNTAAVNRQLRAFQGGRMLTETRHQQQWPPRAQNASAICNLAGQPQQPQQQQQSQGVCYQAGDTRVNQNPQLTLLQVVLLREHNRIADNLQALNPHWQDETVFQEARKINIAQHQMISYYEWLPLFIGAENALKNGIIYATHDYVNDYNPTVDPTVLNEHATAAFRYFHSLIAGRLDLVTEERNSYGNLRLSDWINRPGILEQGDNFAELARGLNTQPELAADPHHDSEVTQFLFRADQQFGIDLKAFDVQRDRDHALASYNDYRQFCGLAQAHSFDQLLDVIRPEHVDKLRQLYKSVDDIELTVGGSLERHVAGTLAGPTFLCILTEQFYRTRVGDRFWFENGGTGGTGFTPAQLAEVRKASISRLLCDNAQGVRRMQPRGFERISPHANAVLECDQLPAVDLTKWRDLAY